VFSFALTVSALCSVLVAIVPVAIALRRSTLDLTGTRVAAARTRLSSCLVVAGLLAAIGLYGLVSYTVVRSLRELAIRIALGGRRTRVLALVMSRGLRLVVAGLVIGTAMSLWVVRFLTSYLFGVAPRDPWTIGLTVTVFFIAGMAGVFLPARRASRIDPMEALRMP
jgi:putative ABC transport system permease protein